MYGRVLQNGVIQISDKYVPNCTPEYKLVIEEDMLEEKEGFSINYSYKGDKNGIVHKIWEYREIIVEENE